MVALAPELVDSLSGVASQAREGYEAGAWAITEAVALHPSFEDTNVPRSALARAIIAREFRTAAGRHGLDVRTALGGAVEVYERTGNEYAVIRLRSAEEVAGELRVIANSGSTWGGSSEDGLWRETPFVFGWTPGSADSVEFFVAEVVGQTDAAVSYLEFGWTHRFRTPTSPSDASFTPDRDDSLEGWDLSDEGDSSEQA